jgi:hypothetical protein
VNIAAEKGPRRIKVPTMHLLGKRVPPFYDFIVDIKELF